MTRSRRRLRAGLVLAIVELAVVVPLGGTALPSARAQVAELSAFDAVAGADGVRIEVVAPNLLVANLFDGGAPVAHAAIDSVGVSQAFAYLPHPGEAAVTAPSLLFPLIGLPAPPAYPLMATSVHPTQPESRVDAGAFSVSARSDERSSEASAASGDDASGNAAARVSTAASTEADPESGELVASASSSVSGFFAAEVGFGSVESSARVVRSPAGDDVVESTFEVEGFTIAGQSVTVGDNGLSLPGSAPIGLPVGEAVVGAQPLLDLAGVSVEYLPETEIEDGVISAGLLVTMPSPLDAPFDGTMTLTFGRVRAAAFAGTRPDNGGPTTTSSGAAGSAAPSESAVGSSVPGTAESAGAPASSPASPAPGAGAAPTASTFSVVPLDTSAVSFYLVLVAGSAVALFGSILLRHFGVKLAWT